jgi:hypothetical protein
MLKWVNDVWIQDCEMEEFKFSIYVIIVSEGIPQNSRNSDISRKCEVFVYSDRAKFENLRFVVFDWTDLTNF